MTKLWLRLNQRERTIVLVALSLLGLVLVRYLIVDPYLGRRAWVINQLEVLSQLLEKQKRFITQGKAFGQQTESLEAELKGLNSALLDGSTAPLAASALQKVVTEIASKSGVKIATTRVVNPQPDGPFSRISIRVDLNGRVSQIANLIKGIDSSPKLLLVSEITIRSLRPAVRRRGRSSPALQGRLRASVVIAGFSRLSASR